MRTEVKKKGLKKAPKSGRRQTFAEDRSKPVGSSREEEKLMLEVKPDSISDEEWASLLVGERDIKNISKDRLR